MSTLVVRGTQNGDTAEEASGGAVVINATPNNMSSSEPYHGWRFPNVTLASSVSVSAATVSLYGSSKNLSTTGVTVKGYLNANPPTWTTTASGISSLYTGSPTTHSYSWGSVTLVTSGFTASGDLSPIITELLG